MTITLEAAISISVFEAMAPLWLRLLVHSFLPFGPRQVTDRSSCGLAPIPAKHVTELWTASDSGSSTWLTANCHTSRR